MKNIEKIEKIVKEAGVFNLSNDHADGRLNSAFSEESIKEKLKQSAELQDIKTFLPPERFWYDIAFEIDQVFIPINIKVTKGNSADNVSSKKSMFYAFTGIDPETKSITRFSSFHEELFKNINLTADFDYYFIIVYKDTLEVKVTSLMEIETLTPNGNNLPFQCKWNGVKKTKRNREEQIKYILSIYFESWNKKVSDFNQLKEYMEDL
jgi:hypothetical protein